MKNKDIENDLNIDFNNAWLRVRGAFYFIPSLNTLKLGTIK